MADELLRQNRFGSLPKWNQLGVPAKRWPLHLKDVPPVNRQLISDLTVMDILLKDAWRTSLRWITEVPEGVERGHTVEAKLSPEGIARMVSVGQAEKTEAHLVMSTVNIFPVEERAKERERVIKHTKAFNERFGRDTLLGLKLLRAKDLVGTVHDGTYCVTLDFSSWFDQHEIAEEVRPWFCFFAYGQWYRLTRLPMGMRQAVDIADTATRIIASFPVAKGVRVDTYVDNIRFLGNCQADVIAAAVEFVMRAHGVGATINEISPALGQKRAQIEEAITGRFHDVTNDAESIATVCDRCNIAESDLRASNPSLVGVGRSAILRRGRLTLRPGLVTTSGEFLGIHFDYIRKVVKVGSKAIRKFEALREVFNAGGTYRNFLAIFGILFFSLQATGVHASHRYYALREYSETARVLQRDPGRLECAWKCSPSRLVHVLAWIDDVLANKEVKVPKRVTAPFADFVLVVDASRWGWGALLLDQRTGAIRTWNEPWKAGWIGARVSAWSEPEGAKQAILHFFPSGTAQSIAVLSDSSTAVGAYSKGRSMKYSVNRAIMEFEAVFQDWNVRWYHVPGELNLADALSRGIALEDASKGLKDTAQQVRRLVRGLPPEEGPILSQEDM